MAREYNEIKAKLRSTLKALGKYDKGMEFRIDIAAGAALLYQRLVKDIEKLSSPVVRDYEDMELPAAPDEAVRLLPAAAREYHNALVALGLAEGFIDNSPKVGRPPKEVPAMSDRDQLAQLMGRTIGADE